MKKLMIMLAMVVGSNTFAAANGAPVAEEVTVEEAAALNCFEAAVEDRATSEYGLPNDAFGLLSIVLGTAVRCGVAGMSAPWAWLESKGITVEYDYPVGGGSNN